MSESETVETVDEETKHENAPRKRIRHRKRLLYENLLKQMEFYFSDANLNKDRFLSNLIKNDPFIPVSEFLKFNKIRSMTHDVNDIIKALTQSTFLELSEDKLKQARDNVDILIIETAIEESEPEKPAVIIREDIDLLVILIGHTQSHHQQIFFYLKSLKTPTQYYMRLLRHCLANGKIKVKRKTPILPYDADARTVYVESIPVKANQEWLEKVFSDFGRIAYISLPKFKDTQKLKGFGFIEFDKPQEAQKCINAFTKMGCKLPTCMPPEDLSSIKMFSVENNEPIDANESKDDGEPPKKKSKKTKDKKKNLELKLDHDSDSERRVDTPTEENKSLATPTEEGKTTDAESKEEMTSQDESKNDQEPIRKKKLKKRKKKNGSKDKSKLSKSEVQNGGLWGLQVLPKNEWKALRNKYLNLQRKNLKELRARMHNKKHVYSAIPAAAAPSLEAESGIKVQEMESSKTVAPFERIPGVFVDEVLPEPCLDVRLTKRTIKTNIHAQHVEVKEGQTQVIIRFDSAKAADEYCANCANRARVLHGAEEAEQWARAEAGRGRQRAPPAPATRAALATAAPASPQPTHTHIRFDD